MELDLRQADNTTHQVKKLSIDNLRTFVENFELPIKDEGLKVCHTLNLKRIQQNTGI